MQSFEKLQSKFPFITNWEQTRLTRKGHCVMEGSIITSSSHFHPDAYGDDGDWETQPGLLAVTAIVDKVTRQVYTHRVEEW